MDYEKTPSFYKSNEFFIKYLGQTSYYTALQSALEKLMELTEAHNVLELGSATGSTMMRLSEKFPDILINGVDIRKDIVDLANENAKDYRNLSFLCKDMCQYVKEDISKFDLIYLLYSFHHIRDPLYLKEEFLLNCYKNMKKGGYLVILETFLFNEMRVINKEKIEHLFKIRSEEGYASTFWSSLKGISKDEIKFAKEVGRFSQKTELEAGAKVVDRDEEYLISSEWLCEKSKAIGFKVIVHEPCNSLNEKVVLLQK